VNQSLDDNEVTATVTHVKRNGDFFIVDVVYTTTDGGRLEQQSVFWEWEGSICTCPMAHQGKAVKVDQPTIDRLGKDLSAEWIVAFYGGRTTEGD